MIFPFSTICLQPCDDGYFVIGGPVDPNPSEVTGDVGEGENLLTVEDNQLDISRDSLEDDEASLRHQQQQRADVISASTPSDDQMSPSTPFSSLKSLYIDSHPLSKAHSPTKRNIKPYQLPTPVGVSES